MEHTPKASPNSSPNPSLLHRSHSPGVVVAYNDACVIMGQKKEIENLEELRNVLHRDEMDLDRRCDKITLSLVNNITVYVMMMGVGSLCGFLISTKKTLYLLLGMMAMTYLVGVGFKIFTAFKKLKMMQLKMNEIKRRRGKLKKIVRDVRKLKKIVDATLGINSARSQVAQMEDALHIESQGFKEDHINFLIVICVASFVYLLSIVSWTFFMHTGEQNFSIFGVAQPPMYLNCLLRVSG
ncbi:hypothetical protein Pfo_030818 [Paulownia fortunei]|nr:hypothetical protein Pfo_030818 [Paulownia fortunei]